ncbi:hypothetical protein H8959_002464, partial [Pygathrix nigripes]
TDAFPDGIIITQPGRLTRVFLTTCNASTVMLDRHELGGHLLMEISAFHVVGLASFCCFRDTEGSTSILVHTPCGDRAQFRGLGTLTQGGEGHRSPPTQDRVEVCGEQMTAWISTPTAQGRPCMDSTAGLQLSPRALDKVSAQMSSVTANLCVGCMDPRQEAARGVLQLSVPDRKSGTSS